MAGAKQPAFPAEDIAWFKGLRYAPRSSGMGAPILVKRYAGVRFYDTAHARYVTLDELREWRDRGIAFVVRDARTNEDISRVLLA